MAVNLVKGGRIDLRKKDGGLQKIKFGCGWDPIKSGGKSGGLFGFFKPSAETVENVDLDASIVAFNAQGNIDTAVYFGNRSAYNNAIFHSGDNLTGEGDGDDETIIVDLTKIPAQVARLVLTISSYRGQTFETIQAAQCNIRDDKDNILATYDMAGGSKMTGIIVGEATRVGDSWNFMAVGEYRTGRTYAELVR